MHTYIKVGTSDWFWIIENFELLEFELSRFYCILRILPPKNENFQMKNSGSFHISAQNMDCRYLLEPPRRDGSYEYPQSMF